jgi:hypothetical protein
VLSSNWRGQIRPQNKLGGGGGLLIRAQLNNIVSAARQPPASIAAACESNSLNESQLWVLFCSLPDAEKCARVDFVKETSFEQDFSWLVTDTTLNINHVPGQWHYATSTKVAGSSPDEVIAFFN